MRTLITLLSKKCFSWIYAHRAFRHCDAYALPRVSMWMSAVDAIGFCLLSAVLTFPVWVAAYLLEASSLVAFTVAFATSLPLSFAFAVAVVRFVAQRFLAFFPFVLAELIAAITVTGFCRFQVAGEYEDVSVFFQDVVGRPFGFLDR